MAQDFAQSLFGVASDVAGSPTDVTRSLAQGVELASNIEGIQRARQQMEQQKQELQLKKINSVMDTLQIASKSKDSRLKNYLLKNVFPAKVNALGLNDFFGKGTMEMLAQSDEAQKKILGLQMDLDQRIRSGQITAADAYKQAQGILSDPEQLAMLDTDQLFDASKFASSEEGKSYRAKQMAEAQMGKQVQGQQAAGQVELAKKTADVYNTFKSAGGKANVESTISKLEGALAQLESGEVKTGTPKATLFAESNFLSNVDPKLKALMDDVRGSVNMRAALADPNPTERQVNAILSRSFDPRLPVAQNIKKLKDAIAATKNEVQMKQQEFIKQGLMPESEAYQYKPKPAQSLKEKFMKMSQAQQEAYAKKNGMSLEDVKKAFGE